MGKHVLRKNVAPKLDRDPNQPKANAKKEAKNSFDGGMSSLIRPTNAVCVATEQDLKKPIRVQFAGEETEDAGAGGVTKEFFPS